MSFLLVRRHRDNKAYVVGMHGECRLEVKKEVSREDLDALPRVTKIEVLFLMVQNWTNGSQDWQEMVKMKKTRGHLGRKTTAATSPTTAMGSSKLRETERVQAGKKI